VKEKMMSVEVPRVSSKEDCCDVILYIFTSVLQKQQHSMKQ